MTNISSNDLTYTQELYFEQVINHSIAQLWQERKEGYLASISNNSIRKKSMGKKVAGKSDLGKKKLYWCQLTHPSHTKSIMVINGRIESCWKYQELFFDLFKQGFDVYSYDHQGQGLSERLVEHSDIGHVIEFDDYVQDMAQMVEHFDLKNKNHSCYLLAHSMGGTVATRYLQTNPQHPFDKVALSAPMYGINMEWYLTPVAALLSQLLTAVYPKPHYAPGQVAYFPKPFVGNKLSQSRVRYEWFRKLYDDKPILKVGGPSAQWVWQGLMAAKQCIQQTRRITLPLLLLQAGDDQIVSNQAQTRFIKKLAKTNPSCQCKVIDGSRHEVLFEQDQYRNQSLTAICHFFNKEEPQ